MLIAQYAQLGRVKLSQFDIYLVLVLRSGGSTILDWKIIIGAVGCKHLKLVGAMCARSFSALRPAKLDQWGLGDGKPVTILPAKLIWPGKHVTFQTGAPAPKCDGFFEKPVAIK